MFPHRLLSVKKGGESLCFAYTKLCALEQGTDSPCCCRETALSNTKECGMFEGYTMETVNVSDPPAPHIYDPGRAESIEICF